jgi:hypothetical protein
MLFNRVVLFVLFLGAASNIFANDIQERFRVNVTTDVGVSVSSYKPTLGKNWQSLFVPNGGTMKLGTTSHPFEFAFGAEFVPVLAKGRVRIPISYGLLDITRSGARLARREVSSTTVHWWDPVTAADVVVEHFSPRVGVGIKIGKSVFIPSVQHYRLVAREFTGVDCQGCKNTSKVYSGKKLESGASPRLDILMEAGDGALRDVGLYAETFGAKTWRFGLTIRWKVR